MAICPNCGQENPDGFRFCGACAAPLTEDDVPAGREERKIVTVLFCDLVGSTAQAERLDPEDVRALLARYHDRVRYELERFGGTVEKFIGDAVMALFGAPIAHEDDPERAVRAALAIREWAGEEGELQVRIGITTGEALIALGARPAAGEGMASGDVVNTAARLQSAAPVNGILVDDTTYRATDACGRVRRVARGRCEGQVRGRSPCGRSLHARSRVHVERGGGAAARRSREGARGSARGAPARPRGPRATARHPRRRAGDRQEPARLRALQGDRDRWRADLLAPGPVVALRRGSQLLGAGRDREGAGGRARNR